MPAYHTSMPANLDLASAFGRHALHLVHENHADLSANLLNLVRSFVYTYTLTI